MATHAPFPDMPWVQGGHPLEKKKAAGDALTLLEFAPGFEDPNWCGHGHVIYIVEGEFGLTLAGEQLRLTAGEACRVSPGERHKAINPGELPVRLFVWSTP
jgi:mannose-6-phosphate isomerase-like protein (cupin superfamily)